MPQSNPTANNIIQRILNCHDYVTFATTTNISTSTFLTENAFKILHFYLTATVLKMFKFLIIVILCKILLSNSPINHLNHFPRLPFQNVKIFLVQRWRQQHQPILNNSYLKISRTFSTFKLAANLRQDQSKLLLPLLHNCTHTQFTKCDDNPEIEHDVDTEPLIDDKGERFCSVVIATMM